MGDFDCYCCLCSGPLYTPSQIGSSAPRALRRRRRRVEQKRLALIGKTEWNSDTSDSEDEDEDGQDNEDDEEIDEYEERATYDPELSTEESTYWILYFQVLGFNPKAPGGAKAFISGNADYDDAGLVDVSLGSDPNQPSLSDNGSFDCYTPSNDNDVVFPFHSNCMTVLSKVYQWSMAKQGHGESINQDFVKLDLDSLYDAATLLSEPYAVRLRLDYGDISGVDQCWESRPGEEYSVADPLKPILEMIEIPLISSASESLYSQVRTSIDPFSKLPVEMINEICRYLPGDDLSSFLIASFRVHSVSLEPIFWKALGTSRMPWAWELWERTSKHEAQSGPGIDYKKLYFLVDSRTSIGFGMTTLVGDWMGLANRRRIWTTCLDLLPHYFQSFQDRMLDPEICADIIHGTISGPVFPVSYLPVPDSDLVQRKYFLHSWRELRNFPSIFEAYWNSDGNLVGLGISSRNSNRVLGRSLSSDSNINHSITKTAGRINTGEWIQSISVGIRLSQPLRGSAVQRVTVNLTSGRKIVLGKSGGSHPVRQLLGSGGFTLVGLSGQIGLNGVIGSLGILQCPTPKASYDKTCPKLTLAERLLWNQSSSSITHDRDVNLRPLIVPEDTPIAALTPHESFSWTAGSEKFSKLERISARLSIIPGETGILQLQCRFIRKYWEPKRGVGSGSGDVSEELADSEETPVHHFDVNGPGGERITGVRAQGGNGKISAISLSTNHGRQTTFGQDTQGLWTTFDETGEECIFGLAAAFSRSVEFQERNLPLMNSVLVMTRKPDS